jgi:hypothetical protein
MRGGESAGISTALPFEKRYIKKFNMRRKKATCIRDDSH